MSSTSRINGREEEKYNLGQIMKDPECQARQFAPILWATGHDRSKKSMYNMYHVYYKKLKGETMYNERTREHQK